MATLHIANGRTALVDDEDYPRLSEFTWTTMSTSKHSGKMVYYPAYYAVVDGKNRCFLLHRVVMGCTFGDGKVIDHINRDTFDARKQNLRYCTHGENIANQGGHRRRNPKASIYLGVWLRRGKHGNMWHGEVTKDHRRYRVGPFQDEKEAAIARDRVALRLYGRYASLNFPSLQGVGYAPEISLD